MPTNDFLPFATAGGANVTSQGVYAAAGYVSTGRASGILPSDVYNKIARQSSIAAYLLGQLVVDQLGVDALDNGTVATVLANLKLAIAKTPTLPTVQKFTSGSGTYTPTSVNVRRIRVRLIGPGAGGGAAITNNGVAAIADASFGTWTAIRGAVGLAIGAGGAGGTGGVDGTGVLVLRVPGGGGGSGLPAIGAVGAIGGAGGNGVFGGGGKGVSGATAGVAGATNSGGGGSGGSDNAGHGGGGGGSGEYVEFWVNGPSATAYVVPIGGLGGPAGTSAGGNGAASVLIIEEFYS